MSDGSLTRAGAAVVTGGTGFLGSHLCEALLDAGRPVVCIDNLVTGAAENVAHLQARSGFTLLKQDVSDGIGRSRRSDWVASRASFVAIDDHSTTISWLW